MSNPRESIRSSREPRRSATLELTSGKKKGRTVRGGGGESEKTSKLRGTPQSGRMLFPSGRARATVGD